MKTTGRYSWGWAVFLPLCRRPSRARSPIAAGRSPAVPVVAPGLFSPCFLFRRRSSNRRQLKDLGDLAEGAAYVLSVYCFWVIGVFGLIQFGPRWRKNEMSRKKSATSGASPVECRVNQIRDVVGLLVLWTLLAVVFARCQAVLQEDHFFTADFPGNIWNALRSWVS